MVSERTTIISRADLLRCLLAGIDEEIDGVASALGFMREIRRETRHAPARVDYLDDFQIEKPLSPPTEEDQIYFYRVTKCESIKTSDESMADYPAWYTESDETLLDKDRESCVPHHQKLCFLPLVPWARLWPFLHKTLSNIGSGWQPDMDRVVRRVAKGEFLQHIPLKQRKTWASSARLLIDISEDTFGLRYDFINLRDRLLRLRGAHGLQIHYLKDTPGGNVYYWENEREVVKPWVVPPSDMPLLIISDLGALAKSRNKLYAWLVFGRELAVQGCRPVVLMPVPVRLIDSRLLKYFDCVSWDRGSRLLPLLNARPDSIESEVHQAKVRRLLERLAPALRVNSTLLRATRYLLTSDSFDVGHEAAVWQHPAIHNHGDEFVWQVSDHEPFLQAFRQLPTSQQQAMINSIASYHAQLPEVVYFEAMQNCIQLSPEQVKEEVHEAVQRYIGALVRTYERHADYKGLSQWVGRLLLSRQKANILRENNPLLAALWGIYLKRSAEAGIDILYPDGINKELMQPFLSGVKKPYYYELRQQGDTLIFTAKDGIECNDGFDAKGSLLTTITSGIDFIIKKTTTQHDSQVAHIVRFGHDGTAKVVIDGTIKYELETDLEKVLVEPLRKPKSAVVIGSDMKGLYIKSKEDNGDIVRWCWYPPSIVSNGKINHETPGYWKSDVFDGFIWHKDFKRNHFKIPQKLELRQHQRDAIHSVLSAIAEGRNRMLLYMAVGTGRSAVFLHVIRALIGGCWYFNSRVSLPLRVLMLADKNDISRQLYGFFDESGYFDGCRLRFLSNSSELNLVSDNVTATVDFSTIQMMHYFSSRVIRDDSESFSQLSVDGVYDLIIFHDAYRGFMESHNNKWIETLHGLGGVQIGCGSSGVRELMTYFGNVVFECGIEDFIKDDHS